MPKLEKSNSSFCRVILVSSWAASTWLNSWLVALGHRFGETFQNWNVAKSDELLEEVRLSSSEKSTKSSSSERHCKTNTASNQL